MSPMEKNCCEDRLLSFSMAIFMSSPAVLVADDVLGTPITTGSLPSIPLSLREAVSPLRSKRATSSGVVRWLSTGRRGP